MHAKTSLLGKRENRASFVNSNSSRSSQMMRNQGCEIEAVGINYTIQTPGEKSTCFSLLSTNADHSSGRRTRVLSDVNCHAKPWEVLAIVGPSGAGKSSLLEILAGKITPDSGAVYVNGAQSNPNHFRKISGYVTQKETLFPLLTVEETLLFSARLRLRLPAADLRHLVAAVLEELRLSHVAHSRVGSDSLSGGARGISGGERRRVSIGVDVIHQPEVLILDEPTSGLDSSSALQIIDMLHTMALTKGRTIILSIHQPGFRIIKLFSSVVVLANGAVVQSGTVEQIAAALVSAGLDLPPRMNVIEFAIDSIETIQKTQVDKQQPTPPQPEFHPRRRTLQQLFQQSKVIDEELTELNNPDPNHSTKRLRFEFANSRWTETLILSERFAKTVFRTKELFACRTLQMLISGLVLGSIFYNLPDNLEGAMERVGLFAFILTFLLSCTTEALPIFLQEREILMKETSSGSYRISSYVIANAAVYLPFLLILAALFAAPVYWLVGLKRNFTAFSHFLLLIWLILYTANSVVVCFSALVPNFIVGNSVINGVMGSFFLFSGYFISRNEIPSYWIGMHYLSLFKYPYEGFLINEFAGGDRCLERLFGVCAVSGEDVLREEGLGEDSRWRNVAFTIGFIVIYRFVSYVVLRCRCSQRSLKVALF